MVALNQTSITMGSEVLIWCWSLTGWRPYSQLLLFNINSGRPCRHTPARECPALDWSSIQLELQRSPSDVLILLDACYSAGSVDFPLVSRRDPRGARIIELSSLHHAALTDVPQGLAIYHSQEPWLNLWRTRWPKSVIFCRQFASPYPIQTTWTSNGCDGSHDTPRWPNSKSSNWTHHNSGLYCVKGEQF